MSERVFHEKLGIWVVFLPVEEVAEGDTIFMLRWRGDDLPAARVATRVEIHDDGVKIYSNTSNTSMFAATPLGERIMVKWKPPEHEDFMKELEDATL